MLGAKTGKGWVLPLITVIDIYIIWILTSIAGLAITPIEGKLTQIFPGTTELMSQMILIGPNIAAIPFVFIGGALAQKYDSIKLINWSCVVYFIAGALFLIANSMWFIIILCFVCGFASGVLSPVSVVLITRIFTGKKQTEQLGYTSATLNVFLALAMVATGYLADVNWRLPFLMYLLPIVPLLLTKTLSKYLPEPSKEKKAADPTKPKVKYSFSKNCNVPALIRYCAFYFVICLVSTAISIYVPFMFKNPSTAGNLSSMIYVGMMLSGYILNWCLKIMKQYAFGIMMFLTGLGVLMMIIWHGSVWIVGLGIFINSFAFGIGQPYCYDRCAAIATPVAASLSMAWLISMDSFGTIFCPFITEGICDIFHWDINKPLVPFEIWTWISFICTAAIVIRKFWTQIKGYVDRHEHKKLHPALALKNHAAVKVALATASSAAPQGTVEVSASAAPEPASPTQDSLRQKIEDIDQSINKIENQERQNNK